MGEPNMLGVNQVPGVSNPLWYLLPPPNAELYYSNINYNVDSHGSSNAIYSLWSYTVPDNKILILRDMVCGWNPLIIDVAHADYHSVRGISSIGLTLKPNSPWAYADFKWIVSPVSIFICKTAYAGGMLAPSINANNPGPLCFPSGSKPQFALSIGMTISPAVAVGWIRGHVYGWLMPDADNIWSNLT